jgi:hypothetical protein
MLSKEKDTFLRNRKRFIRKMSIAETKPATKLILVIVANTNDPEIGIGCRQDIKSIRHMFKKLCKHMQFEFLELLVMGHNYSKKNVQDAIDILKPDGNDIVVFYYSGHGFSYKKDKAKRFPQVDLRPAKSSNKIKIINENTNNLAELFEAVKSKGARLNIVIGDCCNNTIKFKRATKSGDADFPIKKKTRMSINKVMCEAMFCNYTASILVAAADKGQFAISDDKIGSIFTHNFSNNLKILMKRPTKNEESMPWLQLLEETKKETHLLSKKYQIENGKQGNQIAIFDIQFDKSAY